MKIIKIKYNSQVPRNFSGKVKFENGNILYFLNGEFHRLDGPAFINFNDSYRQYYINGIFICGSGHKNPEQTFYNSKEYKVAKQQEDLLNNMKRIKNIDFIR